MLDCDCDGRPVHRLSKNIPYLRLAGPFAKGFLRPFVTGQWWRAERGCLSRSIPDQSAVAGRFGAVIYLVAAAAEQINHPGGEWKKVTSLRERDPTTWRAVRASGSTGRFVNGA
jgi:hypothetical protein